MAYQFLSLLPLAQKVLEHMKELIATLAQNKDSRTQLICQLGYKQKC